MLGKFTTIEGPDGTGKSTGLYWLCNYLVTLGIVPVRTREPGGTPLAEQMREILLSPSEELLCPLSEVMIVGAARAQHLERVIRPAMARGQHVFCDRFADSTYAYQGGGRGLHEMVAKVERLVLDGFEPDYTLYFDAETEIAIDRLRARKGKSDRLDQELSDFFARVRTAYEERFRANPHRMYRIDANGSIESVEAQLKHWVHEYFIPAISNPDG